MEMLYSPSSPSSSTASSDSIPSLNDPGASSEGDACPNVAASSNLVCIGDDDAVGEDDGSGASNNDEPSKDSILTLLGMRFLPTTPNNAHHVPSSLASPITPMVGQSSTFPGTPSANGGHSLSSSFLAPSPLTPTSSLGLPTSFANSALSAMSGASATGAFPYYSTSLLSPSSSSPPAVYTPPSPTMPSASAYHHQHHQHHQHQPYQYQPAAASSYPLTSQLLYPQQPQQQYHQPQQYQIVPQPTYQQQQQQQQQYQPQQQHASSGPFGYMPSQQLYVQAHLNYDPAGDHHSFVEPQGVGHKRKADLALADSTLHQQQQHRPYQPQLHNSGELAVAPHRRDHDGYGAHHHNHHQGQQYQHQHNGGNHHHHHHQQQQQPHHQLVVAAKAKKRRVRKTWTERFQQLKEFKHRFGHCKVPKGWNEDPKLARWVCNMRQSKRMGKMKEERVRKLEELGFLWRCEQTGKVIWEEMIEKLKAFQARHGHCRVPVEWPEDPQLSAWVVYVRQRNRANNLSHEKVKELDAIQFVWTDLATAANGSTAAAGTSGGQRRSDAGDADPGRPELSY